MRSVGIVTLPEPSLPALFSNLGYFQRKISEEHNSNTKVIFIMNRRHYRRIQRLAAEDQKYLHLTLYAERLQQFGRLQLVDYWKYYNSKTDAKNLNEEGTRISEELCGDDLLKMCDKGYEWWYKYARNPAQERIRESIGADMKSFRESQKSDRRIWKKGGYRGSKKLTNDYVKKLVNKMIAALWVRKKLNQERELEITGVAGGKEYQVAVDHLWAHDWLAEELELESARCYFSSGDYQQVMSGLMNRIGELAREIEGHNQDDEFVLGSRVGFMDLFNPARLERDLRSVDKREVEQILEKFRTTQFGSRDNWNVDYYVNYIYRSMTEDPPDLARSASKSVTEVIDGIFSQIPTAYIRQGLTNRLNSLHYSTRLEDLKQSHHNDAAVFIAATIITDPKYNYNRYSRFHNKRIKKRCQWARRLFGSPIEDDQAWRDTQYQMLSWTDRPSWYELPDWFTENYP